MKNYVISLVSANERREHITSEFSKHAIKFSFFDAITPDLISSVAKDLGLDIVNSDLRNSEIACLLSHVVLWQKAIDDNLDYIGIFEDDIHLGEQANKILSNTNWIPDNAHIIKVEAFYPKVLASIRSSFIPTSNRKLVALKSKHMGTGGYILSNSGAKALLAFIKEYQKLIPIDHIMFKEYLVKGEYKVYQMMPAICIQDFILMRNNTTLPSYLAEDRKARKGSCIKIEEKPSLHKKITRELTRFFTQFIRLLKAEAIVKVKFK